MISTTSFFLVLASLPAQTVGGALQRDFHWSGSTLNQEHGFSVAIAGDLDGDGHDDLLVSARSNDPGGLSNAGSVAPSKEPKISTEMASATSSSGRQAPPIPARSTSTPVRMAPCSNNGTDLPLMIALDAPSHWSVTWIAMGPGISLSVLLPQALEASTPPGRPSSSPALQVPSSSSGTARRPWPASAMRSRAPVT